MTGSNAIGSNAIGIHTAQTASSAAHRPLTGVFETLVDQHREVLRLLRDAGSIADPQKRTERWAEARRRLLSHERAESDSVYSAVEGQEAARTLLQQHQAQAAELEAAVEQLDAIDPSSDAWIESLRDVLAMLDDHVRDEESDFFPRAQRLLGENTARDLDERFESAQREALRAIG